MFKIATKPAIIFAFLCLFSMPKRLVFGVSDGDLRRTAPTWRGSASAMKDGHVEYDDDYEDNILLNESDALNDWSDDDSNGSSGEIWQNDDDNDNDDDDDVGQSTTDESEEEIISENKISHPKGVIIEPIDAKNKINIEPEETINSEKNVKKHKKLGKVCKSGASTSENVISNGNPKRYSERKKRKFVEQFLTLKEKGKGKKAQQFEINKKFSEKVGKTISTIYRWKKKLGLTAKGVEYSTEEKKEMIGNFFRLKELFSNKTKMSARAIDSEVSKIVGISVPTIYLWRRDLGITANCPRNRYSTDDKMQIVEQYNELKTTKPHLRLRDVAEMLGIPERTLTTIRKELCPAESPIIYKRRSIYLEFGTKENKCVKCGHLFWPLKANNVKRHLALRHPKLVDQIEAEKANIAIQNKIDTISIDHRKRNASKSDVKMPSTESEFLQK